MRGAKKRQALPAIVLLLLASAPPPPGAEGRDVPAAGTERGKLLDLLLQALDDDGRPLPPRPPRRDRLISRRYSGGAPPPDPRPIAAAAPRTPPAAAAAPPPPRLFAAARAGVKTSWHCCKYARRKEGEVIPESFPISEEWTEHILTQNGCSMNVKQIGIIV